MHSSGVARDPRNDGGSERFESFGRSQASDTTGFQRRLLSLRDSLLLLRISQRFQFWLRRSSSERGVSVFESPVERFQI